MKVDLFRGLILVLAAPLAVACTTDLDGRGARLGTRDATDAGSTRSDGGVCVPTHVVPVRITSGAETQVATMTITTSATGIQISIEALAGWLLGDTYVVIGHDGSFVQFTENETPWIDGYVSTINFDIPLSAAGLDCEDLFKLIVQLHVKDTSTGMVHFASAVGSVRLGPSTDGWKEFYEICCVPEDGGVKPPDAGVDAGPRPDAGDGVNCTRTQGFWRNHPWPTGETLEIAGTTYTRTELLAYIEGGTEGNMCVILGQQLIAALLNVAAGADPITAIGQAEVAWDLLCTPLGTVVPAFTTAGQFLEDFKDTLDAYNMGHIGPGSCPND